MRLIRLGCILAETAGHVKGGHLGRAFTLDVTWPFLLLRKSVCEEYLQLRVNSPQIFSTSCPFFCDIHHSQIQHFQQAIIRWEYRLSFGDLAQLAVEILNGIRGVNKCAHLLRILEIGQ